MFGIKGKEEKGEEGLETEFETEEGFEGNSSLIPFQMLWILLPPRWRKKEMNTTTMTYWELNNSKAF